MHAHGSWAVQIADAQAVDPRRALAAPLRRPLVDQNLGIHVRDGDVVLRIRGPLPDVERPERVEYHPVPQDRTDAPRHGLDVVDRRDQLWVPVHRRPSVVGRRRARPPVEAYDVTGTTSWRRRSLIAILDYP